MAAARRRGRHVGRPAKLALDQIDYARRMIVAGRAQIARSLGVDPSTLRRLLMKGSYTVSKRMTHRPPPSWPDDESHEQ